jgi:Na+/melibiose symporter-like transporter
LPLLPDHSASGRPSATPTVEGRLDLPGAVLGAAGLAAITCGFIEQAPAIGAVGAVLFAAFLVAEARQRYPMLALTVFRSRQFSAANGVTFLLYGALGTALLMVGLVLQQSMGYSPLEAGIATLPITVVMLAFSARAGALARRIGPRIPMTVGPLVMAAGLALMVWIEPGRGYGEAVLPPSVPSPPGWR